MNKNLAQDFASLYGKINADGKLDPFFQSPEVFGYASNDFAAVMLMLKKMARGLPSPAAGRAVEALNLCQKQVDKDTGPLADDRPEWDLIHKLLAALAACA